MAASQRAAISLGVPRSSDGFTRATSPTTRLRDVQFVMIPKLSIIRNAHRKNHGSSYCSLCSASNCSYFHQQTIS